MISKDKITIQKLKRRMAMLSTVILFLMYWIVQKSRDAEYYQSDNYQISLDMIEKEEEIKNLKYQIDSLTSKKIIKVENQIPKIINNKKLENKKDTSERVVINKILERESEITLDTLNR
jgi:hypothetical protein